ncbi:MAG: hypothetical protein ACTHK7_04785 [Aureliella sp.]
MPNAELSELKKQWQADWPSALAAWSHFVQMHEPVWCETLEQEMAAELSGSFAMIRLVDHSIVISLRQIAELKLEAFSKEILAHEIGHHVLCPADLTDNARMLSRMRRGLPGHEAYAPMISNLYADLMINDRLQRSASLDIAGVYRAIEKPNESKLWRLYMRMYELLWKLPPQTLALGAIEARLNQDAQLGARLIRSYARQWLDGAGRFACLCFPYVEEEQEACNRAFKIWCDAVGAGAGGFPDGLSEEDEGEADSILHPAEDPALSGLGDLPGSSGGTGRVRSEDSGRKSTKQARGPFEYSEILQASGVTLSPREIARRFYRERALPHLIPFPARVAAPAHDPLPEGLDTWEISSPIEQIDWWATLLGGTEVIPGVTTRERLIGQSPGTDPQRIPIDLYLGIDCSGSMRDPALNLSYPVLAGTIMVLSALRAGVRVKVVLSGEPGKSISTDGFIRDAEECLKVLTNYLGTGYAFGIHRLAETFLAKDARPLARPVHVLIISDSDMFAMLRETAGGRLGWDVARETVERCGGGATYVLQIPEVASRWAESPESPIYRMRADGWNVHSVTSMDELTAFARQFSRAQYGEAKA